MHLLSKFVCPPGDEDWGLKQKFVSEKPSNCLKKNGPEGRQLNVDCVNISTFTP